MTITCPNCGRPVPPNQNFCGNCGANIRAIEPPQPPPTVNTTAVVIPVADPQSPPDYYGYEENSYQASGRRRPSTAVLAVILAAIAIVCLCCGLVLGLFIPQVWYWLGPTTPTVTPTPAGMLFFALYG